MRNILPASTLEHILPIMKIENDCIVSKYGDITVCFKVELPEIFTLSSEEYENMNSTFVKAIKLLPDYTVIHKQDWFIKETYTPTYDEDETPTFLSKSHHLHFNERPYLNHTCYLFLTKTTKENMRKQSILTTLSRGRIVPSQMLDSDTMSKFMSAVGQFSSVMESTEIQNTAVKMTRLTQDEIIGTDDKAGLIDRYLTLSTSDSVMLKDIQFAPEKVIVGDNHLCLHTLSQLEDLPFDVFTDKKYAKLSTDKSNCQLSFAAPLGLLLPYNHIYNQYVFIGSHQENAKQLESASRRLRSLAKFSRANEVNHDYIEKYLYEIQDKGYQSVRGHFNVFTWTDNPNELKKIKEDTGSQITIMDCKPRHNTMDAPVLFWSAIPGNGADFPIEETFPSFIEQCVCFFTKETCTKDSRSPFGMRMVDRLTGKPLFIDISDEPMKRKIITNRNKFILGGTGSGKSFFTNHMVRQYYEQGAHIVLIDTGDSYFGLCNLINQQTGGKDGIHLSYTEENPIAFNPFYTEDDIFDIEKRESIKTLITALWKKDTDPLTRSEEVTLSDAVNDYLKALKNDIKIKPSFNTFYEFIQNDFSTTLKERHIREKDFDVESFLYVLAPYYRGGEYDYLLNSESEIDLLSKRFVIFELDNIKDHKILFPVVTIIIMEVFISKMRRLRGVRKMILIEEAWKAIAKEGMAEYIKYLFKTVRKFRGEAVVVTQDIEDIISSPIVKDTIINNSDCKILLDLRKFMKNFDKIEALLGLTDKQKAQVLSLNKNNDTSRNFKEVYIDLGSVHSQVYATEVSRQEYLTYTTEDDEKKEVLDTAKKYSGSVEMAIKELTTKNQQDKTNKNL